VKVGRAIFVAAAMTACGFAQNHSVSQGDIEDGGQIYRKNCIGCHGSEGASVAGVDLVNGRYRVATSDEDLVKIIMNGLPGTGMPATVLSVSRPPLILAYLRSLKDNKGKKSIAAKGGDASRGKELFWGKGGCGGCHRIQNEGGRSGPNLSDAGHLLSSLEIEAAILDPDDGYPFGTRPVRMERENGVALTGLLLNQDTYSVQVIDQEGSLRSIQRKGLRRMVPASSWMPAYRGKFDAQELADVIAYVSKQRGVQ
jgi:putative heme-binding domain-containing protein